MDFLKKLSVFLKREGFIFVPYMVVGVAFGLAVGSVYGDFLGVAVTTAGSLAGAAFDKRTDINRSLRIVMRSLSMGAVFGLNSSKSSGEKSKPSFSGIEKLLRIVFKPDDLEDLMESFEVNFQYDCEKFGRQWARFYLWKDAVFCFLHKTYKVTPIAKLVDGLIKKWEA